MWAPNGRTQTAIFSIRIQSKPFVKSVMQGSSIIDLWKLGQSQSKSSQLRSREWFPKQLKIVGVGKFSFLKFVAKLRC